MKQNIIQFMRYAAPYKGNFINSFLCLEKNLNKKNIKIIYIFPKETQNQEWAKSFLVEGKIVYFLSGNFFKDLIMIKKIIKKENIKIIHVHFAGYKDFILLKCAKLLSNKVVFITHLHNHYKEKNLKLLEAVLRKIKKSDYYIGVSSSVAEDIIRKGFDKNKVVSIPNAIDFTRLDTFNRNEKEVLNINNKKVILMFGFDYYRKGVDLVIKALNNTNFKENIVLLISLSRNKESVYNRILSDLSVNELPQWIKLVDSRDDVATYYNISDAFISSSREEGFCYSLVEAGYCNCMIVASNIPAQDSLSIPDTFYYDVENLKSLAEAIKKTIYINEKRKISINENQREFVKREYSLEKWVNKMMKLYIE